MKTIMKTINKSGLLVKITNNFTLNKIATSYSDANHSIYINIIFKIRTTQKNVSMYPKLGYVDTFLI